MLPTTLPYGARTFLEPQDVARGCLADLSRTSSVPAAGYCAAGTAAANGNDLGCTPAISSMTRTTWQL